MISSDVLYRGQNGVGVIPLKFQGEMSAIGFISHCRIRGTERRLEH